MIGEPFVCEEHSAAAVIAGLGRYTVCANDPPWTALAAAVPRPQRVVVAWDMDIDHLEAVAAVDDGSDVIVGLGGGTAMDTAKFVAWRQGKRLVQIPSITSVDAGFTDAVGVRVGGNVRYIGRVVPELVVLDLALIRSAPAYLNRAGIGDILSCHTGLWDWRAASAAGHGPAWDDDLAALGRTLLVELEAAAPDVAAVTDDGVRFLAAAYRRIGAACAHAGHSRFEEGSEHFWAYAYEHATGAHPVHGEIIAMATVALAAVQDNNPGWARNTVAKGGVRAHPDDLGVSEGEFTAALAGLRDYARANELDIGVADLVDITTAHIERAWAAARSLPRVAG